MLAMAEPRLHAREARRPFRIEPISRQQFFADGVTGRRSLNLPCASQHQRWPCAALMAANRPALMLIYATGVRIQSAASFRHHGAAQGTSTPVAII